METGDTHGDSRERHEGARARGARPKIDWDAARAYYLSLAPDERTLAAVAARFGASLRTVQTHSASEKWKEQARAISAETRARTAESLVEARVAEVEEMRRLINASLAGYAEALRKGMRMSPADLERLNRLSLALTEEAISPPRLEEQDGAVKLAKRTPEHVRAVIDALADAGVLETIGLTRLQPVPSDPEQNPDDKGG